MRSMLAAVLLVACAHAPPPSEGFIRERSHAVIDAYDRGDLAAVRDALATSYVHFEGGKPTTRDDELAKLAARKPDAPHIGTRSWQKDYVYVHPDDAVFVGQAAEQAAGDGPHGAMRYEGWYTLQWHRDGGVWRLALWTWQRAGTAAERDRWNDVFRDGLGFSKEPNRLLVQTVAGVTPGRALDLAMGQGRNALYLASQGWTVTGVDFSAEGIRLAREEASRRGLSLDAVYADLDSYDLGEGRWDLVTMIYAGDDPKWIARVQKALAPGGLFVVEYFHDHDTVAPGDGSFARGELAKLFASGFDIVRDEVVDDVPDWGNARTSLVRFVARKHRN